MRSLTLQTNDTILNSGEEVGKLSFAASAESDGGSAISVGARVIAQAEGDFTISSNPTSLVFATASATAAASGKIKITDNGNIMPMGNNLYDIGGQNLRFKNTYAASGYFSVAEFSNLVNHGAAEITNTPTGTTQTITLNNGNHQTLALTSATGTVAVTLTVPSNVSAGTIIVVQHASSVRDVTWAVSAGTVKWMGVEPNWGADAVSNVRIVSWRYNGSVMYLASTEVAT